MQSNLNIIFGRTEILNILEKRVVNLKEGYRQNIALIGQRLIGKSSIIQYFLNKLNDNNVTYIYLEPKYLEFKTFAKNFIGSFLNSFASCENLARSNNLDILINSTEKLIPQTIEHVKKIITKLEKEKNSTIYHDLINTPGIFTKETGKVCLVILDEFQDIIEGLNIENAYQDLNKAITVQRNCMYIITSSLKYQAKKILSEKLSLLFGNFETIEVKPFDIKTTKDFINYRLDNIDLAWSLQNFLYDFTSGQPFYLEIICRELLRLTRTHQNQVITLSELSTCLNNLLYYEWGLLNQLFKNYLNTINQGKSGHLLLSIILSVARDKRRINDITFHLRKQKIIILQKINKLLELDILSKNGNLYYLTDKMFNFWLKFIYLKKLESLTNSDTAYSDSFQTEMQNLIDGFIRSSEKSISDRVIELFNLFENESVQMNGYKYRLFRFKEIKPIIFKEIDNNRGLIAHSKNILWLIILREGFLREGDVIKFITECKNYKYKPQRRIIVSTGETDANAKLKALQEKIWIWNLADLNLFLTLHGKHCIVK